MRGTNFADLASYLGRLTELLANGNAERFAKWTEQYARVELIKGLGLSTYTQLLNSYRSLFRAKPL